MLQEQLT